MVPTSPRPVADTSGPETGVLRFPDGRPGLRPCRNPPDQVPDRPPDVSPSLRPGLVLRRWTPPGRSSGVGNPRAGVPVRQRNITSKRRPDVSPLAGSGTRAVLVSPVDTVQTWIVAPDTRKEGPGCPVTGKRCTHRSVTPKSLTKFLNIGPE